LKSCIAGNVGVKKHEDTSVKKQIALRTVGQTTL